MRNRKAKKFGQKSGQPWDLYIVGVFALIGLVFSMEKILPNLKNQVSTPSSSISGGSVQAAMGIGTERLLPLGCLSKGAGPIKIKSIDGYLRVEGQVCGKSHPKKNVKVRNVTNGYEGSIVYQNEKSQFLSDYLILEKGYNVIHIEWEDAQGKIQKMVSEVYQPIDKNEHTTIKNGLLR